MEPDKAIAMVRELGLAAGNVVLAVNGLRGGPKSAERRFDAAIWTVLAALLGREPTEEEVKQGGAW